ncbi:hypothetical protein B0T10DRAFT_462604 [Thelonectria olida]|uniref:Uncharacterized protein n=1 Tax=Thelonectria olida TaxID=1576542 RepID=A0A9P8VZM2_9HYPO|nr:hypothetical protein B0T10DRAFT_462604 [Thelonectria olida]
MDSGVTTTLETFAPLSEDNCEGTDKTDGIELGTAATKDLTPTIIMNGAERTDDFPTRVSTSITVTDPNGQVSTIFPPRFTGGIADGETSQTYPQARTSLRNPLSQPTQAVLCQPYPAEFYIEVTGTLPEWPELTQERPKLLPCLVADPPHSISPDGRPTFSKEPTEFSDTETVTTTTQTLVDVRNCVWLQRSGHYSVTGHIRDGKKDGRTDCSNCLLMEGRNENKLDFIENQLFEFVQDPAEVYTAEYDDFEALFWRLNVFISDADRLRTWTLEVGSVLEECDNDLYPCYDPTVELVYQDNAKPQFMYISWPNIDLEAPFVDLMDAYCFDGSDGGDIPAYVIDTGVSASRPVRYLPSYMVENRSPTTKSKS